MSHTIFCLLVSAILLMYCIFKDMEFIRFK